MGCTQSRTKTYSFSIVRGENSVVQLSSNGNSKAQFKQIMEESNNVNINGVKKVALIVCCNYENHSLYLGDPALNDGILSYKNFQNLGYTPVMLHDISPSKFLNTIKTYVSIPNIELVFYYIGHGMQVRDTSGDEPDGMDECFVLKGGNVLDDTVAKLIKENNKTKKLTLIADACHSATIFDIGRNDPTITTIGACKDNQSASQYYFDRVGHGTFTFFFWKSIKENGFDVSKNMSWMNEYMSLFHQQCICNQDQGKVF